ncbi:MAG: hypothetical protein M1272_05650, partial [Firmicutes bacterium]|nr:hypothetical protein [Bacillota bacterium]
FTKPRSNAVDERSLIQKLHHVMRSIKVFTGLDVNHEAARRLYEGLGFRDVWHTITYGMALDSD